MITYFHSSVSFSQAVSLMTASLVSTSVLTNGLKHLILSQPKTERLVKKPKIDIQLRKGRMHVGIVFRMRRGKKCNVILRKLEECGFINVLYL